LDHISDDDVKFGLDDTVSIGPKSDIEDDWVHSQISDSSPIQVPVFLDQSGVCGSDSDEKVEISSGDEESQVPPKDAPPGWQGKTTTRKTKHGITGVHREYNQAVVDQIAQEEEKKKLTKLQERYISLRDPFQVYSVKEKIGSGSAGEVVFGETNQGQKS